MLVEAGGELFVCFLVGATSKVLLFALYEFSRWLINVSRLIFSNELNESWQRGTGLETEREDHTLSPPQPPFLFNNCFSLSLSLGLFLKLSLLSLPLSHTLSQLLIPPSLQLSLLSLSLSRERSSSISSEARQPSRLKKLWAEKKFRLDFVKKSFYSSFFWTNVVEVNPKYF